MKWIRAAAIGGLVALVVIGVVAFKIAGKKAKAASTPSGEIQWIDVGKTQTSDVYVVPQSNGESATVVYYRPGLLEVRGYDAKTRELSSPSRIATPAIARSHQLYCDKDSGGNVWIAFNGSLARYSPVSRVSRVWDLPRSAYPVPANADSLWDNQAEAWRREEVSGFALDASDTVWVTREFVHALLSFDPNAERFNEHVVPDWMESAGVVVPQEKGELFVSRGLSVLGITTPLKYSRFRVSDERWSTIEDTGTFEGADPGGNVYLKVGGRMRSIDPTTGGVMTTPSPIGVDSYVVAFGRDGDVWYVDSANDLALTNRSAGISKTYDLPLVQVDDRVARPGFFGAKIDGRGNLWFSYANAFNKAGVAIR